MASFLESPIPALSLGASLALAAFLFYWHTREPVWLKAIAGAVIGAALLAILSFVVDTDREQVTRRVHHLAAVLEKNDTAAVLACLSPAADADELRALAETGLGLFEIRTAKVSELTVEPDRAAGAALATFAGSLGGRMRRGGPLGADFESPMLVPRRYRLYYRREGDSGEWRIFLVEQRAIVGDEPWRPLNLDR